MKKRKLKRTIKVLFSVLVLLLVIGATLILNRSQSVELNQEKTELIFDQSAQKTQEKEIVPKEIEYVEYPGFSSSYTFNEEVRLLSLSNPKDNSSYFIYTISKDGEVLYKSDAIAPDFEVVVDLYELLNDGVHSLKINIASYDIESQTKDFYSPSYSVNAYVEKEI